MEKRKQIKAIEKSNIFGRSKVEKCTVAHLHSHLHSFLDLMLSTMKDVFQT